MNTEICTAIHSTVERLHDNDTIYVRDGEYEEFGDALVRALEEVIDVLPAVRERRTSNIEDEIRAAVEDAFSQQAAAGLLFDGETAHASVTEAVLAQMRS